MANRSDKLRGPGGPTVHDKRCWVETRGEWASNRRRNLALGLDRFGNPLPRMQGTNPRALGTNPRAQGPKWKSS